MIKTIVIFLLFVGLAFGAASEIGTVPVADINEIGTVPIENVAEFGTVEVGGCSGDLKFSWHMENLTITSGTPAGCVDGSGDTTATASGDGNATLSSVRKSDGTYSGLYPDGNETHLFTSSSDIISGLEGKIILDIYITTFALNAGILRFTDGTNYLDIRMQDSSSNVDFRAWWTDGTDNAYLTVDDGTYIDIGEWLRLTLQWKLSASAADWKMEVCELTLPDTTANCQSQGPEDDLGTWTGNPTTMTIGNVTANAAAFNIDNFKIYATSGL